MQFQKHYVINVITQLYIGLILRFDTISRLSPNSLELELGYRRLKQDGFTLISVTDGGFEDNQTSKRNRQILSTISEYQREEIVFNLSVK